MPLASRAAYEMQTTMKQTSLINDNQRLVAIINEFGRKLPIHDAGNGPLWIHRNSIGISGIVRADSWESAYSICEDEFFPAGDDFDPADFATIFLCGRELWLHEHGNSWEAWQQLSDVEKEAVFLAPGKDVPYMGEVCDHPCWQEQYGFRSNARKEADGSLSSIYAKDLNGDSLEPLTAELASELKLTVEVADVE